MTPGVYFQGFKENIKKGQILFGIKYNFLLPLCSLSRSVFFGQKRGFKTKQTIFENIENKKLGKVQEKRPVNYKLH